MNNELRKKAGSIWLFFLDLIFPIEGLGCGREGEWLCSACFKAINLKSEQYCLNCKKTNDFGQFCPTCRLNYDLNGIWIAALYDDRLVARAIKSLKYYFVSSLVGDLSRLLISFVDALMEQARIVKPELAFGLAWRSFRKIQGLPSALLDFQGNLIVPVPLSKKRLRWRGFNQAEILAQSFAGHYGREMNGRDLVRLKHKKPQAKLSEAGRLINLKNCFVWQGADLRRRNIILIDDVVTTGATLNECAKVLKANGAGEVWGLVVAKG